MFLIFMFFFFFKQKTAYEMRISDWSSDVCSSDLRRCHDTGAGMSVGLDHRLGSGRAARGLSGGEISDCAAAKDRRATSKISSGWPPPSRNQIGRASCRERVCQYV